MLGLFTRRWRHRGKLLGPSLIDSLIWGEDKWKPGSVLPCEAICFKWCRWWGSFPSYKYNGDWSYSSTRNTPCPCRRRRSKSPSCGSTIREVITPNTRARCYGRSYTYPRTRSSPSCFHTRSRASWTNAFSLGNKYLLHAFIQVRVNIVCVASWHD